jgi:hypothetical protein
LEPALDRGLWFSAKPAYVKMMDAFAAAVTAFRARAPAGFRLTVVWVDSTVQHFGSSSDGRYVKGSAKNAASRRGSLAPCRAMPWAKLRPNAWRNVKARQAAQAAGMSYFRLEDFAWDLSSRHPGVSRRAGGFAVDCAHYCVNFGGLPHFTLLAVLHEVGSRGCQGRGCRV